MRRPVNTSSKLTAAMLIKAKEELLWPYGEEYVFVEDKLEHFDRDREPAEWVWQAGRADTLEDRLRRATTWEEAMRRGADGSGRKLARQSTKVLRAARSAVGAAQAPAVSRGTTISTSEAQSRWRRDDRVKGGGARDARAAARRLERIMKELQSRGQATQASPPQPGAEGFQAAGDGDQAPPDAPRRAKRAGPGGEAVDKRAREGGPAPTPAPILTNGTAPARSLAKGAASAAGLGPTPTSRPASAPAAGEAPAATPTPVQGLAPAPHPEQSEGGGMGPTKRKRVARGLSEGNKAPRVTRETSREKRAREGDGLPSAKRILRGASGPASHQS